MRKQLAVALALVVALAGVPLTGGTRGSSIRQSHVDAAPAAAYLVAPAAAYASRAGIMPATLIARQGTATTTFVGATDTVTVPGYADIFLAGRAFPFEIAGPLGTDVAGRNAPPGVKIAVGAGHAITVVAKFATAHGFSIALAPDANGYVQRLILAGSAERGIPRLGLSSVRAPIDGLVGVFIGTRPNSGAVPPTLNFSTTRAQDAATVKPRLYQVFYIGTGLTNSGALKRFIVPGGAAYLYLGSLDHAGANHDNHGVMLAFVTGARLLAVRVVATATRIPVRRVATATRTRTPTATATAMPGPRPRKPTGTPTAIGVIGSELATDTATGTPTPTPSPALPSGGFQYNAQGQIVNALGTPVALNALGTPINSQGTPVNAQGQTVNTQGTPVNVSGQPVNQQGTPIPTNTSIPIATNTPVPPATGSATTTGTVTSTPTPGPGTPIVQSVTERWSQYQFDYQHNGYQALDTANAQAGIAPDLDPNADPNSPFFAGKLHQLTASPPINGDVTVAGGPVLGLNGLYFTSGQDAALRCIWANGSPANGFSCPAGFSLNNRISFGSNFEDDVPVINPGSASENIIYYLSHNNPTGAVAANGQTGSLTAYNANTGGPVTTYTGGLALATAPGVALTVYNNICYVPAEDGFLYYLACGPNGTGAILHKVPLAGTPLAGAAVDTPNNQVVVAEQTGGGALGSATFGKGTTGKLEAFDATTGAPKWNVTLPGSGAIYTPFQPIVISNPPGVVVATNYGIAAYSLGNGAQIWADTGTATNVLNTGQNVSYNAEDAPAYDPFPTNEASPSIFVGLPVTDSSGNIIAHELARLSAAGGQIVAVGSSAQSAVAISGAPVTDTGAPNTVLSSRARDVVFYADNGGAVYALDAASLAPLLGTINHAFPDLARPGIPGLIPPNTAVTPPPPASPPIGASLVIANGHLYFGNSVGTIFNYSF